jgi:DNA (cytosine-5)-methyltransferase 1
VHLTKFRQNSTGTALDEPMHTICAGGGKPERPATGGAMGLVSAFLAKHYTGVVGSDLVDPLGTVTSSDHHSLVAANIVKLRNNCVGQDADAPLDTITTGGHFAEVRSFLLSYYGTDQAPQLGGPLATVTSHDRFGLVTIQGQDYQIVDIGLRMLSPRELFRAQGFPSQYVIGDDPSQGLTLSKSAQVRMCGNSVCPPMSEALVRSNFAHEALLYERPRATSLTDSSQWSKPDRAPSSDGFTYG